MSVTFFISDLHLQASQPQITRLFLQFLQESAHKADALYILGDLFEAWIGDDDLSPFNTQILQALRAATQSGLPVYFMRGNRDFLIGRAFAKQTGVTVLNDPTVIELYGVRTLLMHGDSLCTLDKKHQRMRRLTSNRFCCWLGTQLPLSLRRKLSVLWRSKSRQHHQRLEDYVMDVYPETVGRIMQQYQTPRLIHGHTHRPKIHTLAHGQRIVLGAWHDTGSVLICDSSQTCQLQTLNTSWIHSKSK